MDTRANRSADYQPVYSSNVEYTLDEATNAPIGFSL